MLCERMREKGMDRDWVLLKGKETGSLELSYLCLMICRLGPDIMSVTIFLAHRFLLLLLFYFYGVCLQMLWMTFMLLSWPGISCKRNKYISVIKLRYSKRTTSLDRHQQQCRPHEERGGGRLSWDSQICREMNKYILKMWGKGGRDIRARGD